MANKQLDAAAKDFVDMLKRHGVEVGRELISDANKLQLEFAQSTTRAAAAISEPGFAKVLQAERDILFMAAAGHAIDRGDSFDNRIAGMIEGALSIASRMLGIPPVV